MRPKSLSGYRPRRLKAEPPEESGPIPGETDVDRVKVALRCLFAAPVLVMTLAASAQTLKTVLVLSS